MQDAAQEDNCYHRYQELGGIINEQDYESILARAKSATVPDIALIKQLELIAEFAGIELHNAKGSIDQRTILYGILRTDTKPKGVQYHHSQMCDQRLLAEALRMLGNTYALDKLVDAYHKVGTYCPICLKVIASGKECR